MTVIAIVATEVALVDPLTATVRSRTLTEAVTKGQAVYILTTGKAGVADANVGGKLQFRGIALNAGAAGETIDICQEGELFGFTLTALDYDVIVYLSDTAGALDTAAGSTTVQTGRVVPVNDKDLTRVLHIQSDMLRDWS